MTTTTAPTTLPVETVTPIRPSEAIRLGCLTTAAGRGTYLRLVSSGIEACAYGAMAVGYGLDPYCTDHREIDHFLLRADSLLSGKHDGGPCPEPGCSDNRYDDVIHLNDDHRWSRERIADWLESLGL